MLSQGPDSAFSTVGSIRRRVRVATQMTLYLMRMCVRYMSRFFKSSSLLMSDSERTALRILIDLEWAEARDDYAAAGQPFGDGRGLDVWIEFDQQTTVN